MSVEELTYALETYIRESSRNYVDEAMALVPSDVGQRLYDTPLVRVGSADDPEWEEMKRPEAVGHLFRTPKEWLPEAVSVVSYFAPFSDFVVEGNKRDAVDVGNGWLYARVEGQAFLTEVNRFLERWFRERGYRAVAPYASAGFRYVFEAGTNAEIADKSLSFTSNWSERHVAYLRLRAGDVFAFEGAHHRTRGERPFRQCRDRRPAARHETPLHGALRLLLDVRSLCAQLSGTGHFARTRQVASSVLLLFRHAAGEICAALRLRQVPGQCAVRAENPQKRISSVFELHFVRKEASPYPDVKTE